MFADRAKIYIRSGKGGDGHVSFRRELFVPSGGPDGGDGGRGGDVIFEVDKGLNALSDYRHKRKYAAGDGEPGGKRRCHGADGKDIILKVPEGTVIKDAASGKVIADMSGDNRRQVVLKGGKGGLGNQHFATATMQVPKYAQPGQPAKELEVNLELKVIADVGLIGFLILLFIQGRQHALLGIFRDRRVLATSTAGTFFGPFVGVAFSLMAVQYTGAGIGSTLMALTPVLIILPSHYIFKERITFRQILGTLISIIGVSLFFL